MSSGGSGESVQLDHDYCTISTSSMDVAPPPQPFYHSDASEYIADKVNHHESEDKIRSSEKSYDEEKVYSRLPEYYMVLAPQRIERNDVKGRKIAVRDDESWGESSSKKDSGLESGEVSDASEEIAASPGDTVQHSNIKCLARDRPGKKPVILKSLASKTSLLSSNGKNCTNILSVNGKDYHVAAGSVNGSKLSSGNAEGVSLKTGKEMTMISVLKKCQIGSVSNACGNNVAHSNIVSSEGSICIKEEPQEPKKRKLNLQEYRSRLKELDRIRESRENGCDYPSCSSSVSVGTSMVEGAKNNSSTTSVVCAKPDASGEETVSVAVDEGSVACETVLRPMMQSVEVQTLPEDTVPVGYDTGKHARQDDEKERRESRTRDRRKRQYRTRHASNSSSTSSSSSANSRSSRRHHTSLRSRHRHRSR